MMETAKKDFRASKYDSMRGRGGARGRGRGSYASKVNTRADGGQRKRSPGNPNSVMQQFGEIVSELGGVKDALRELREAKKEEAEDADEEADLNDCEPPAYPHRDIRVAYDRVRVGEGAAILFYVAMSLVLAYCLWHFQNFPFIALSLATALLGVLLCARWLVRYPSGSTAYLRYMIGTVPVVNVNVTAALDSLVEGSYVSPISRNGNALLHSIYWWSWQIRAWEDGHDVVPVQLYIPLAAGLHEVVGRDTRSTNQRANKFVKDRALLSVYRAVNLYNGDSTHLAVADEIVEQTTAKIRPLSEKDRVLQAEPTALRVTNIILHSKWFSELARGSARMALVRSRNQQIADESLVTPTLRKAKSNVFYMFLLLAMTLCVRGLQPGAVLHGLSAFDVQYISGIIDVIFIAPLIEEILKAGVHSVLTKAFHLPKPFVGLCFGAWEFIYVHNCQAISVPAFVMHVVVGFMSFRPAFVCHVLFNCIVIFVTADADRIAEKARDHPMVKFLDGNFATRTYLCFHWRSDADHGGLTHLNAEICDPYPRIQFVERSPKWLKIAQAWDAANGRSDDLWLQQSLAWTKEHSLGAAGWRTISLITFGLLLSAMPHLVDFGRFYAVGYRVGEVPLPEVGKHGAKITKFARFYDPCKRRSISNTLGFALKFLSPTFPDFYHGPTTLHGCLLRFCRNPPKANKYKLKLLRRFVRRFVRANYTPIPSDADVSLEAWLLKTHYTDGRKNELRRAWYVNECVQRRDCECASFSKREGYMAYKPARGINSRGDVFKCATGPFFKLMEEQCYKQDCYHDGILDLDPHAMGPFIKHIPVHLRPQFIETYLGHFPGRYYETDYSQFEKHFTPEILNSIEMILYRHLLKNFPSQFALIHSAMTGVNKCCFDTFTIKVKGRRMSGEMCTSLGNGFANLMLFKFAAYLKGGSATGIVEGDDALFYSSVELTQQDFSDLGFDIKIMVHTDLTRTSFCGMLMSRDLNTLRDPRKVLVKFAWSLSPLRNCSVRVRTELLRAKAMALAYECPRCPILHALAKRVLYVTRGVKARFEHDYWSQDVAMWACEFSEQTQKMLQAQPTDDIRFDFYDVFGITPAIQKEVEARISLWDGQPWSDGLVDSLMELDDCRDFFHKYVASTEQLAMGCVGDL